MLQTVTIQNFKSLKDVTVHLQKVNLLIGPNNSGKSNFLKALALIKDFYAHRIHPAYFDFQRNYHKQNHTNTFTRKHPIKFSFQWAEKYENANNALYQVELIGYNADQGNRLVYNAAFGISDKEVSDDFRILDLHFVEKWFKDFYAVYEGEKPMYPNTARFEEIIKFYARNSMRQLLLLFGSDSFKALDWHGSPGELLRGVVNIDKYLPFDLEELFNTIKIYKPDPTRITKESLLMFDKHVNEDCSNLVAFLDNMRDEHPNVWSAIERDLNKCIPDFVGINFGKVKIGNQESIGKRFGLRDKQGKTYWAEELSEGTVYFLALLAIVHQPNPPKVLLLEEPEKGIHPRRISEVMDLIFRLAEDKDIQIILTSHSTQVVDEFQDIPESVFVFDIKDGETKIKNLLTDIIEPDNEKADKKGYPKLDFAKHTLGEHWAIGFLGGVPAK